MVSELPHTDGWLEHKFIESTHVRRWDFFPFADKVEAGKESRIYGREFTGAQESPSLVFARETWEITFWYFAGVQTIDLLSFVFPLSFYVNISKFQRLRNRFLWFFFGTSILSLIIINFLWDAVNLKISVDIRISMKKKLLSNENRWCFFSRYKKQACKAPTAATRSLR